MQVVCLTACVTRKWVGRDNAIVTESTSSHTKCLKTRRVPLVGCTLCWTAADARGPDTCESRFKKQLWRIRMSLGNSTKIAPQLLSWRAGNYLVAPRSTRRAAPITWSNFHFTPERCVECDANWSQASCLASKFEASSSAAQRLALPAGGRDETAPF